jgi:hypothetical protein
MQRLLQRAGRGLNARPLASAGKARGGDGTTSEDDSGDEEEEAPFEPLLLWTSPHQGGEPRGLPSQTCVRPVLAGDFVRMPAGLSRRSQPLSLSHRSFRSPFVFAPW